MAARPLAYLSEGGRDAGRLPHPSIPLRQGDAGELAILAALSQVYTPAAKAANKKAGSFPTSKSKAVVGPPLGPSIDGACTPADGHCDPLWWEHGTAAEPTAEPFDDVAEAALQEKLLHAVFPKLFLG